MEYDHLDTEREPDIQYGTMRRFQTALGEPSRTSAHSCTARHTTYEPGYVFEGGPSASLPVAGVNTFIPFKLKLAMTVRAGSDDSQSNHARASCEVSRTR